MSMGDSSICDRVLSERVLSQEGISQMPLSDTAGFGSPSGKKLVWLGQIVSSVSL